MVYIRSTETAVLTWLELQECLSLTVEDHTPEASTHPSIWSHWDSKYIKKALSNCFPEGLSWAEDPIGWIPSYRRMRATEQRQLAAAIEVCNHLLLTIVFLFPSTISLALFPLGRVGRLALETHPPIKPIFHPFIYTLNCQDCTRQVLQRPFYLGCLFKIFIQDKVNILSIYFGRTPIVLFGFASRP